MTARCVNPLSILSVQPDGARKPCPAHPRLWRKRRAFTEHVEKLAELVSEKTGGEFTMNISYGGLSNDRENLDGISIGAFEMAQFYAGYHPDKNPSVTVLELPFLCVSSLEQEIAVSMAVYQHPAVVKDLGSWNATLLMPSPLPQCNIVGTGDAPSTLADFDGLSACATGGIGAAMKTVGAAPTSMASSEVRQAMNSGVVKAVSFALHAHMSFGTIENATWWTTNRSLGTVNCPVVVNTDALAHYVDFYNHQTMAAWGPALDARGIERVIFSDAEVTAFKDAAAAPVVTEWIESNTARGLPAQELYDLVTVGAQASDPHQSSLSVTHICVGQVGFFISLNIWMEPEYGHCIPCTFR